MNTLVDFLLHADRKLLELVTTYGSWVYGILFVIVFAETGFVVTPFLPGDSLLFATGALCATGALKTPIAAGLLFAAAFTGNAVNYAIGRMIGPRVFNARDRTSTAHRLLNEQHLNRAHAFFELADAVIRIADICGRYDIDLAFAIREKMAYNATRPAMHGRAF